MIDLPPEPMKVTIYSAQASSGRPVEIAAQMARDLLASRNLGFRLAVRDISAQYRQSLLGIAWALILPVANTLVWIFLTSSGVVRVAETVIPYPVYVFTGTMLWAIFMDSVNAPLQTTNAAKPMLAKLNFPREALILSGFYQTAFNGIIKVGLILCILVIFGVGLNWSLLLVPLGLIALVISGFAIGILLTPVGMLYTDIGRGLPLLLQFLMYLTPVVFPMPTSGAAATIFQLNPMTPLILTTRDWLTGMPPDNLLGFGLAACAFLVTFFFAWFLYRTAMPIIIERMGS